jgi:hypothetical protein
VSNLPILIALMMEAICSSETAFLIKATLHNISGDGFFLNLLDYFPKLNYLAIILAAFND